MFRDEKICSCNCHAECWLLQKRSVKTDKERWSFQKWHLGFLIHSENLAVWEQKSKMFLPNLFKKNNLKLNPWKVYHFYFCNINKSVYRNLIVFHKNKSIFCQALNSLINITFLSAFLFACCCCCFMPIIFVLDFLAWIFRHLSSDACFTVSKFSDFAHFEMHNSFSKSKVFFVLLWFT